MPDTFFVADVHLGAGNEMRLQTFADFIAYVRSCNGDLYILGDFFDFWANNRALYQAMEPVLEVLQGLAAGGNRIGFIYGNRDFLIAPATLQRFGIEFLGEQADISLGNLRVHITHGYTLCLNDSAFPVYKKYMWPVFRGFDRLLPGAIANYIVRTFILRSKPDISQHRPPRFHFTRAVVEAHFRRGIDAVICGHTHVEETFRAGSRGFYALGCWDDMAGSYIVHSQGTFTRATFPSAG